MKTLSFAFVLLLAACGGKDEATPEQKAKLREVNQSSNQVMQAGQSAVQQRGGRKIFGDDKNKTNSLDSSGSALRSEISDADCTFDMTVPRSSSSLSSVHSSLLRSMARIARW